MITFKEFSINELFDKKTVKGYPKKAENLTEQPTGFHTFGQNIKYQYPQKILLDPKYLFKVDPSKPILAFASSTGSIGIISESFYRSGNNGAFQALIPKFKDYDYRQLLFILTSIKKIFKSYNYATNINNVPQLKIMLPVNVNNQIDWQYMHERISELEHERISELEHERISELEHYLKVTGLNDYHLTSNDKEVLNKKVETKEFKIKDLFNIKKGKRLTKANQVKGDIPFIGSSSTNNGITAYIANNKYIHPAGSITVTYNGSVGQAFLQDKAFWASDDVNVLYSKYNISKEAKLYLITSLKKLSVKYSYNFKWTIEKMNNDTIVLPVTNNHQPDWQYMEQYIKAIEKLTIKNVVDYKDQVIMSTREIVNNQ